MAYNIFKESIKEALAKRFGEKVTIEYKEVLKNNGVALDGITVKSPDNPVSPTVYINDFYEDYLKGRDINDIAIRIENIIKDNVIEFDFTPEELLGFENVKDQICYKLVNYEKNKDLLNTIPHKIFLDLAIVYFIAVKKEDFAGVILINNAHLNYWNKSAEEIDALARENTPRLYKPEIKSIAETLTNLIESKGESLDDYSDLKETLCDYEMYVLSNEQKQYGAAVILYDNVAKDFSSSLGSNLYVLPSSLHELILLPSELVDSEETLNQMICEVNATEVPFQDILSDHFYYYDREKDELINPKTNTAEKLA